MPRAWRMMVANERLVANPIARRAAEWVAWVVPAAVAGLGGFDGWARSAAQSDRDLIDFIEDGDAGVALAAVAAVLLALVASAWLLAAFCASIRDGRPQLGAARGIFARILLLDIVATAFVIGAVLAGPVPATFAVLAVSVGLLYAPYVIALEGQGIVEAIVTGLRVVRAAPGPALLTVASALLLLALGDELLHRPIVEAATVFAPLVLAAIFFDGLASYVIDCTVIATIVESEGAPTDAPAPAAA